MQYILSSHATKVGGDLMFFASLIDVERERSKTGQARCKNLGAACGKAVEAGIAEALGLVMGDSAGATPSAGETGIAWIYSKPAHLEFMKSETTVRLYQRCVTAGTCTPPRSEEDDRKCNWGDVDRVGHPVNCVDWKQAADFCQWVGARLPTESEWYAEASAAGTRDFPWGDTYPSCDQAVFTRRGGGCGLRLTTAPGCSRPLGNSVSGLCDMAGNVWEWVSTADGPNHLAMGGSWRCVAAEKIAADSQETFSEAFWGHIVGFRCVRPPAGQERH